MTINIRMDIPGRARGGSSLLSMDVEPTSTIEDVKWYINLALAGSGKQSLIKHCLLHFDGKLLEDSKLTLKDCGIESQSTLQLSTMLQLHIDMEGLSFVNLSDISLILTASSSDTVDAVKDKIIQIKQLAIEPSACFLYYNYEKLEDSAKLSDYDVEDGSRLKFCDCERNFSVVWIAAGNRHTRTAVTYSKHDNCCPKALLSLLCLPCILVACCVDLYRNVYQSQHQERETRDDRSRVQNTGEWSY